MAIQRRSRRQLFRTHGLAWMLTAALVPLSPAAARPTEIFAQETDVALAASPIIVIGYWPKAPRIPHRIIRGDTIERDETRTKLVITKVLHGSISPGSHELLYSYGVGWNDQGKDLNSASSTLAMTNTDVSKPNIWFLTWGKGWDPADKHQYLKLGTYRCIQPPNLAPLYESLRGADRDVRIGACLESRDSEVVKLALQFVSDDWYVWPNGGYDPEASRRPKPRRVTGQIARVLRIALAGPDKCRSEAEALYGDMAGRTSVSYMRNWLKDKHAAIRLVAAAYLVRFGDWQSLPGIEAACRRAAEDDRSGDYETGFQNATIACALIFEMRSKKDLRYAPALISFLENDVQGSGSADGIPSQWARAALKALTGFTFPLSVASSSKAWARASTVQSRSSRLQLLAKSLGKWDDPLVAEVRAALDRRGGAIRKAGHNGEPDDLLVEVVVTNRAPQAVTITGRPASTDLNCSQGGGSFGADPGATNEMFRLVTLRPGGSLRYRTYIWDRALNPGERSDMSLFFGSPGKGNRPGVWVGTIKAKLIHLASKPSIRKSAR